VKRESGGKGHLGKRDPSGLRVTEDPEEAPQPACAERVAQGKKEKKSACPQKRYGAGTPERHGAENRLRQAIRALTPGTIKRRGEINRNSTVATARG